MTIHIVKRGETLFYIARLYGLTSEFIEHINGLKNPENLVTGQALLILFPEFTHTVMAGESLYTIAEKYSVTENLILRNNPQIKDVYNLKPGGSLVIKYEGQVLFEKEIEVNAYTYGNLSREYIRSVLPFLTYITSFTYGIKTDGTLIEVKDRDIIYDAVYFGVKPLMHISTLTSEGVFSNALAADILNDKQKQALIIENIYNEIQEKGYAGVDIDFEFLPAENSLDYVEFVESLTGFLNPEGYVVVVALAPKVSPEQRGLLYEGHSYEGLGNAANYAFVMTYEWGYTYGPPMAVAPIESVKRVLDYAVKAIEAKKILMGIPTYGYDWKLPYAAGTTKARSISNGQAIELAVKYGSEIFFDEYSKSPYFYYTDEENIIHEVWFEDVRSIGEKLKLIESYGIAGCGYWNLERPFEQNWMLLNYMYIIKN